MGVCPIQTERRGEEKICPWVTKQWEKTKGREEGSEPHLGTLESLGGLCGQAGTLTCVVGGGSTFSKFSRKERSWSLAWPRVSSTSLLKAGSKRWRWGSWVGIDRTFFREDETRKPHYPHSSQWSAMMGVFITVSCGCCRLLAPSPLRIHPSLGVQECCPAGCSHPRTCAPGIPSSHPWSLVQG